MIRKITQNTSKIERFGQESAKISGQNLWEEHFNHVFPFHFQADLPIIFNMTVMEPECSICYNNITVNNKEDNKMPDFGNSFSGLKKERKLTEQELIRSIRFMVAAEYEAIQLYMQLAESIDNKLAIEVLKDIANEEKVHAGEFLRLLKQLSPDEEEFYAQGAKEVEDEIKKG